MQHHFLSEKITILTLKAHLKTMSANSVPVVAIQTAVMVFHVVSSIPLTLSRILCTFVNNQAIPILLYRSSKYKQKSQAVKFVNPHFTFLSD